MIVRIYSIIAKIATRYGGAKGRFLTVFAEDSKYNLYKQFYNFHRNGGSDAEIRKATFYEMKKEGLVVDGTKGGLLIGPLHTEGGILVVREYVDKVVLVGEIEGYEYLLNSKSSAQYHQEISRMNAVYKIIRRISSFVPYEPVKGIRTIDVRSRYVDGKSERPLLLIRGKVQWVVNVISSREFLQKLNELNESGL